VEFVATHKLCNNTDKRLEVITSWTMNNWSKPMQSFSLKPGESRPFSCNKVSFVVDTSWIFYFIPSLLLLVPIPLGFYHSLQERPEAHNLLVITGLVIITSCNLCNSI